MESVVGTVDTRHEIRVRRGHRGGGYKKQNTLCQAGHRKECSISLDRGGNKVWIDVSEARLRGEDMSGKGLTSCQLASS